MMKFQSKINVIAKKTFKFYGELVKGEYGDYNPYIGSIDVELRLNNEGKKVFSASCDMRDGSGGQCLEEFLNYPLTEKGLFMTIFGLWQRNHLNDMHAGTEAQEAEIEKWKAEGNKYDYTKACDHLKEVGLYNDNGYIYGTSWLYREISADDMATIRKLLEIK